MIRTTAAALLTFTLAACGSTEGPLRYEVPIPPPQEQIRVASSSVELREVSLPLYAELETISVRSADASLRSDTEVLWADEPVRAISRGLVTYLSALTGARVAESPWPLADLPDSELEVRFDRLVADPDGVFRASGQYYIAPRGGSGREVTGRFAASAPYQPENLASVAAAKGSVIAEIARQIARGGL
ncbi:PqiC family protein [Halovulum sp. GXIMD14794]